MKMRVKLLISIAILFVCYSLIIFFLPTWIVIRDIDTVTLQVEKTLIEKDAHSLANQQLLISDILREKRESVNGLLFMAQQNPSIVKELEGFSDAKQTDLALAEMARLASYFPDLDYLQLDSPDGENHLVMMLAEAQLVPAVLDYSLPTTYPSIALQPKNDDHTPFMGILFGTPQEGDHRYYVLVPEGLTQSELDSLSGGIQKIASQFRWEPTLTHSQVFSAEGAAHSDVQEWVEKNQMIQILIAALPINQKRGGTILGVGKVWEGKSDARVLLKEALLSTTAPFDAVSYYNDNLPMQQSVPIAASDALIVSPALKHLYLANTLKVDGFFLTAGVPLDQLAKQLAIWANKSILIRVDQKVWGGYQPDGVQYTKSEVDHFANQTILTEGQSIAQEEEQLDHGNTPQLTQIAADPTKLYYVNLVSFDHGRLGFGLLSSVKDAQKFANMNRLIGRSLALKISLQLFLVSLMIGVIISIFSVKRAIKFTIRPIVLIAQATEQVVAGNYDAVQFPDLGKRDDEVATLIESFKEMVKGLQEKEKIRGILDKVVSKDIAAEILKSKIHLGGEDRYVSVLFADIRGFTAMTEEITPQETIQILNACMTRLTRIIEGEGGVIDKYVGDAVMAIYNAPTQNPNHALHAISTGVLMVRTIEQWNKEREQQGKKAIHIGVGINSGEVVAGNMGAEDRLNYTVLGANVNLASRLCDAAAPNQVLISEATYREEGVAKSFVVEALEPKKLKGFTEPVAVYRVVDFYWDTKESPSDK